MQGQGLSLAQGKPSASLVNLELDGCLDLGDSCLPANWSQAWPHLESVVLRGSFTDHVLAQASGLQELKSLCLCNGLWTDHGLEQRQQGCWPQLKQLTLRGTGWTEGIRQVIKEKWPDLEDQPLEIVRGKA